MQPRQQLNKHYTVQVLKNVTICRLISNKPFANVHRLSSSMQLQQLHCTSITQTNVTTHVGATPHICHNHHNRWLCKRLKSSVKSSAKYMKEIALRVFFYRVCNLTHGVVFHPSWN